MPAGLTLRPDETTQNSYGLYGQDENELLPVLGVSITSAANILDPDAATLALRSLDDDEWNRAIDTLTFSDQGYTVIQDMRDAWLRTALRGGCRCGQAAGR